MMMRFFVLLFVLAGMQSHADGWKSQCSAMLLGPYHDYSEAQDFSIFGQIAPKSVEELERIVKTTNRPLAVRGAGFSMGGQTAAHRGIVVDMRNLNKVVDYRPQEKTIRVQAGATWRQIQEQIDKDNLSVMIMQSYNNFQVGGSLSVNAHGRYLGYGPLIPSVEEVKVMMADGTIRTASRAQNPELFTGVIGGYAALGIILEAKLKLVDNVKMERKVTRFMNKDLRVAIDDMVKFFEKNIETDPDTILFNADIYPRAYDTVDAITYVRTDKDLTDPARLQPPAPTGLWSNAVHAAKISIEQLTNWGKRYRVETVVENDLKEAKIVTRNYEASYDNGYLKPLADRLPILKIFPFARRKALLQEYFIPRAHIGEFMAKLKTIFLENNVNISNISIRHVPANGESLLAWSKVDSFAVVVYYTQPYGHDRGKNLQKAKDWTREMITEVERLGGSFYLPYQIYATRDQFNNAYPKHEKFFELKKKYDPTGKFDNTLWEQYLLSEDTYHYRDLLATSEGKNELIAYFTNIFSINNPERFLTAVEEAMRNTQAHGRDLNDRNIYDELVRVLPKYANGFFKRTAETIKALRVQQNEMARQTAQALKEVGVEHVNGYVEIGSPGRYVWPLKKLISMSGKITVASFLYGVGDWIETSFGLRIPAVAVAKKIKISNYDMFTQDEIPSESVDLATMYVGLHHCPPEKLHAFVASINRILRAGGKFVLRDHAADDHKIAMAFLAHSTYNAGLQLSYDEELSEVRNLQPLEYWYRLMEQAGFKKIGSNHLQPGDPTGNTLMVFEKVQRTPEVEAEIRASIAGAEAPFHDLNILPGYHRPQSNTYMTQAEWFLVDVFRELGNFTRKSPWYEFPFAKFVELYGQVYQSAREFARREGLTDRKAFKEYDEMDKQLMQGMKSLFKVMQWAAHRAAAKGETDVRTQAFLSRFFADYATFMTHTPWYMFPHRKTLADLADKQRVAGSGRLDNQARKLYRQARVMFAAMDMVAALTRRSLGGVQVDPTTSFLLEVNDSAPLPLESDEKVEIERLTKDLVLVRTGRYMPFTRAMEKLADKDVRLVQVAGNTHISVLLRTGVAELTGLQVAFDPVLTYQYPSAALEGGDTAHYQMVRVMVSDLPQFMKQARQSGAEIVRVHDY